MSQLIKNAIFLRDYPNPRGAMEVGGKDPDETGATLKQGMLVVKTSAGFKLAPSAKDAAVGSRVYVLLNSEGDADASPASPVGGGVTDSLVADIGKLGAVLLSEHFEMLTSNIDRDNLAAYTEGAALIQLANGTLVPVSLADDVVADGNYPAYVKVLEAPALSGQDTYVKVARTVEGGIVVAVA